MSYDEEVRLDSFAAPPRPVTDYLTRYSGIRAHDLEGAPAFEEVRARVAAMIDGRTINRSWHVGHGLHTSYNGLARAAADAHSIPNAKKRKSGGRR